MVLPFPATIHIDYFLVLRPGDRKILHRLPPAPDQEREFKDLVSFKPRHEVFVTLHMLWDETLGPIDAAPRELRGELHL